ncbi:hypothetical protein SELMODRAFT_420316 [Selaginella moellendorffii]|uniref:Uncharacterized protein n=1 Tax=Selaginella moellendorffii TaxID=88036 RepID=D8SBL5_SELML|nr:hypothetical protein SELMODRAFT_420316 [Selaginella moellendorffii]
MAVAHERKEVLCEESRLQPACKGNSGSGGKGALHEESSDHKPQPDEGKEASLQESKIELRDSKLVSFSGLAMRAGQLFRRILAGGSEKSQETEELGPISEALWDIKAADIPEAVRQLAEKFPKVGRKERWLTK